MLRIIVFFALLSSALVDTKLLEDKTKAMTQEERHGRLFNLHRSGTVGHSRFKQSKKAGSTKLTKPIIKNTEKELHVNSAPKRSMSKYYDDNKVVVKASSTTSRKRRKPKIHSSGTDRSSLPPSRLYLLLGREFHTPREMTRTTQPPNIFRIKVPKNSNEIIDEHIEDTHSRIIVDANDELEDEASGFNELEDLDLVPFQQHAQNWPLRTDEFSEFQHLNRGENEI